jgi:PRC-barrel domain
MGSWGANDIRPRTRRSPCATDSAPSARIGVVEDVRLDTASGRPTLLSVRAGLLGTWLVHVPVDQVDEVSLTDRRIVLRSGGLLAGPRRV